MLPLGCGYGNLRAKLGHLAFFAVVKRSISVLPCWKYWKRTCGWSSHSWTCSWLVLRRSTKSLTTLGRYSPNKWMCIGEPNSNWFGLNEKAEGIFCPLAFGDNTWLSCCLFWWGLPCQLGEEGRLSALGEQLVTPGFFYVAMSLIGCPEALDRYMLWLRSPSCKCGIRFYGSLQNFV